VPATTGSAATRSQYEGGTADPALVAPEGWVLDQHFLDLPGLPLG
jgi:hypothetical protein